MSCQRAVAQNTLCLAREPRPPGKVGLLIWLSLVADRWVCLLPFTPSHMCKEGRRYVRSTGNCQAPPKSRKNDDKMISETKNLNFFQIKMCIEFPVLRTYRRPSLHMWLGVKGRRQAHRPATSDNRISKATLQDLMCLAPSWEMRVCIKIIILFQ